MLRGVLKPYGVDGHSGRSALSRGWVVPSVKGFSEREGMF